MISFILNNQEISTDLAGSLNLLEFIRKRKRLSGSKLTCGEGECGSCTIIVGELDDEGIKYKSMTSCIMPLYNARCKHILTIEGLEGEGLSPVQLSMIEAVATQCGFCTPGFVMSLTGAFLSGQKTNMAGLIASMDGNICRCTGYKSIMRAAEEISEFKPPSPWSDRLAWLIEHQFVPKYFASIQERLVRMQKADQMPFSENGQSFVAGGTDLYVQKPFEMKMNEHSPLFDVKSLRELKVDSDYCEIGAGVTMEDLNQSAAFKSIFPDGQSWFKKISSTQIRNMSTLGGNLVNASPIGDMTILFLGLDSDIVLSHNKDIRVIKLREFYLDYKKIDLQEGETLISIRFSTPGKDSIFRFEKVSKRTHFDIASVNTACFYQTDSSGNIIEFHLSAGGVAAVPKYCDATCDFILGQKLDFDSLRQAERILQSEIAPISDTRGSAGYKRLLMKQLFFAHFENNLSAELIHAFHD